MGITRGGRLLVLAATALSAMATALVMAPSSQALDGPPDQVGQWGPVLDWGVQGKHMVLLNTGNVLVWSAGDQARIWNPITAVHADAGAVRRRSLRQPGDARRRPRPGRRRSERHAAQRHPVTSIFDPQTRRGRAARTWPTRAGTDGTTLPDGRALVVSGDATNGNRIDTPEIYDPVANTWTRLTSAKRTIGLYPFMYVLPNGKIYEAGTKASTSIFDTRAQGLVVRSGRESAARPTPSRAHV